MPAIFQPRIAKKINKALSVRVLVICSGYKLLWRDFYKGVGRASISPESKLHKIIIIKPSTGQLIHQATSTLDIDLDLISTGFC